MIYVSKTHTCVAKLTDQSDRALISARQLTLVKERRMMKPLCRSFLLWCVTIATRVCKHFRVIIVSSLNVNVVYV